MELPATGETYGPFEVFERLGVGGMATVHRAIERGIEGFAREVALKRLLPHLAEDESFLRAFVREAKLASLLQHGNIVQLYELGRVGPSYFISMEYISGRDLRAAMRQARRVVGPPPIAITLEILAELLDALDYAHNRRDEAGESLGLVHRDISPSNIIIGDTGHLKIIDFGVAKASQGQLQTHTGGIKGKLSYMPPEMVLGRPLDGRSDLFSASVIAHELLTTAPLFTGRDDFQTLDRLQRMSPAPPSAKNRDCPPELDAIVLKGLAKEPDRRWSSAAEMRAELAELAVRHGLHATSRDVAGWIDWAFGPDSARRNLPLTPPEEAAPEQDDSDAFPVALNEGEFEAAWDWLRSNAAPILLAEVPDVSDRVVKPASGPVRPAESEEDAPTLAIQMLDDADLIPLIESGALLPEVSLRRDDSVIALAGPDAVTALNRIDSVLALAAGPDSGAVVALAAGPDSGPVTQATVPLGPVSLKQRRRGVPAPVEWAAGTDAETAKPPRDQLALRAEPEAERPVLTFASAPLTLRDRLDAPPAPWPRPEEPEVRLRPSALRAFLLFLALSVAIAAATAFILRRNEKPPARKLGPAAPAPVAASAPPAAAPAAPATSAAARASDAPALVPPDRVERKRGKRPVLQVAETGRTPDVLDAQLCVDRRGQVASVKILTPVSDAARGALTSELGRWRYRPIKQDGERVSGCFATQVRPRFQ